jgi:hypothetical protein
MERIQIRIRNVGTVQVMTDPDPGCPKTCGSRSRTPVSFPCPKSDGYKRKHFADPSISFRKICFKLHQSFPAAADNAGNVAGSAAAALNGTAIKAAAGAAGTAVGLATAGTSLASSPAMAAGAATAAGSGLAAGAAATAGSGLAAGAAATAGSGLAAGAAATAGAAVAAGSSLAVVESSKQSAVAVLKQTARQETSPSKSHLFTKIAAPFGSRGIRIVT